MIAVQIQMSAEYQMTVSVCFALANVFVCVPQRKESNFAPRKRTIFNWVSRQKSLLNCPNSMQNVKRQTEPTGERIGIE